MGQAGHPHRGMVVGILVLRLAVATNATASEPARAASTGTLHAGRNPVVPAPVRYSSGLTQKPGGRAFGGIEPPFLPPPLSKGVDGITSC